MHGYKANLSFVQLTLFTYRKTPQLKCEITARTTQTQATPKVVRIYRLLRAFRDASPSYNLYDFNSCVTDTHY